MQIFMKSSVSLSPRVNLSLFFRSRQPVQLRNSKPKPEIRIASHHSFCWGKQCYRRCHVALESHQENKGTQSRTCCLESSETTSDNRLWATEVPLRWAKALKAAGSYIYSLPAEGGGVGGGRVELYRLLKWNITSLHHEGYVILGLKTTSEQTNVQPNFRFLSTEIDLIEGKSAGVETAGAARSALCMSKIRCATLPSLCLRCHHPETDFKTKLDLQMINWCISSVFLSSCFLFYCENHLSFTSCPCAFFRPSVLWSLALTSLDSHASHYRSSPLCLFLLISVSVCVCSSVSNSPSWSVSWFSGLFVCCWFLPLSHFCLPVRTDYRVSNLFASKLSTIINKGCFGVGLLSLF